MKKVNWRLRYRGIHRITDSKATERDIFFIPYLLAIYGKTKAPKAEPKSIALIMFPPSPSLIPDWTANFGRRAEADKVEPTIKKPIRE